MEQLRAWIRVAEAARATCLNLPEFDLLLLRQKQRLEELEHVENQRLEKLKRVSFGSDDRDLPIWEKEMPPMPARVVAVDERSTKKREAQDIAMFLACYEQMTGLALRIEEEAEDPDFIAQRSDGQKVGIELTAIQEGGP
jgi:hypothetical protein